jgi:hypothetical protein
MAGAGIVTRYLEKAQFDDSDRPVVAPDSDIVTVANTDKSFYDRVWPVIACGAGLFSDGYLNGVCDRLSLIQPPVCRRA